MTGLALTALAVSAAGVAPPVRAGIEYNLTVLGTLGGAFTFSSAVNDSGQVAGYSYIVDNTTQHAFLSGPGGGAQKDLGTLPGGTVSGGAGVNDSGQVAGFSNSAITEYFHTFLSGPDGGPLKDLGALPEFAESQGLAVNASGQVVGSADLPGHAPRASLYGGGQPGRADPGHPVSRDVAGRPSGIGLGFLSPARTAGSNPEGSSWQTCG
jgi:probable HAF family extracellular repeat protein